MTTAMHTKQELIARAVAHLEGLVDELRDEVRDKLRGEGSTDEGGFSGTIGDYSAQSTENYLKEQALIRRHEAEKHTQQIALLKRLNLNAPTATISLGNLVTTDKGVFLIAYAQKPIVRHGQRYMLIGTDAPIYAVMAGKKTGDTFAFRGITYTVLAIA